MKIKIENEKSEEQIEISFVEWLKLKVFGFGYYKHIKEKNWNGYLPIYVSYCKEHNHYFLDYPHGYEGNLYCDLCFQRKTKVIISK